jgi:thiamine biosynthesis protein ThiI
MQEQNIINAIIKVCGVYSVSPATQINNASLEDLIDVCKTIKINSNTFRVTVNRANKNFRVNSTECSKILGAAILGANPSLKVDLFTPETVVNVDLRENGSAYIFYDIVKGVSGMPVGTSSKGMLLLSGGIDSPVAGFMMAKRGMPLEAIHFYSFPYTSEAAKQKVIDLAKIMSEYTGPIRIHMVKFTHVQESIHENCNSEYMITLMRRIMMRIAERIAKQTNAKAIITGESLAQVASQTIESITVTNAVVKNLPILRPLIGMDKDDITEISRKIGTFETSILPYEDCCTVFLPEHPIIKPRMDRVLKEEQKLDVEALIAEAMENVEIVVANNL